MEQDRDVSVGLVVAAGYDWDAPMQGSHRTKSGMVVYKREAGYARVTKGTLVKVVHVGRNYEERPAPAGRGPRSARGWILVKVVGPRIGKSIAPWTLFGWSDGGNRRRQET